MSAFTAEEREELYQYFTPEMREELDQILRNDPVIWRPLPGPQTMAYYSEADVVGFGGAAGGGKTDLAVGKALTQHRKIAMFRRVGTELTAIEDRIAEITNNDTRKGYNGQKKIWREPVPGVQQIELGSVPNLGDEKGHQGRPKDLLVLDEAANFLEVQARFLMGWVRTTVVGQRTQTLMCFNPPTDADGRWIVEFFAPWLRKNHPNPAKPGELRWFAMIPLPGGRGATDTEVEDSRPFVMVNDARCYEFDARKFKKTDIIQPQSRTFIPSRVTDNIYMGAAYMATLQSLPEPLRSQMLNGDFEAGMQDSEWQVIPTAWVDAAMARWKPLDRKPRMDQMGVDVARGGPDNTIIARRHHRWYDVPLVYPGKETPDGAAVAGLVVASRRDDAPVNVDVIGVGSSAYDFMHETRMQVLGVNVSEASGATARSGRLLFFNVRSQLLWQFREMLDPQYNEGVALPPDPKLKADLCAFTWKLRNFRIYVLSREEIIDKIGRSPDYASAYVLAALEVPRKRDLEVDDRAAQREHDPFAVLGAQGGALEPRQRSHDPYADLTT